MDDFRVGSISPYEPYRDDQPAGRIGERKERRQRSPQQQEEDAFESVAEQAAAESEDPPQDYYTPSEPADE